VDRAELTDERLDYQQQLAWEERQQRLEARWAEALAMNEMIEAHRRWLEDFGDAATS